MAKEPTAGRVKTRLSPPLSREVGADIYKAMLLDAADLLAASGAKNKFLFFDPPESLYFRRFEEWGITIRPQSMGDLGIRMEKAFQEVMTRHQEAALIIGTDIPLLTEIIIEEAVSNLKESDMVIGPSEDGGYYLLGMNKFTEIPFKGIHWSSDMVLQETKKKLDDAAISFTLTDTLSDIDSFLDIKKYTLMMEKGKGKIACGTRFREKAKNIISVLRPYSENQS